jgi:hypothetical protein
MADLSRVSPDTLIQVTLSGIAWKQMLMVMRWHDGKEIHAIKKAASVEDEDQAVILTYAEWELVLRVLTKYLTEVANTTAYMKTEEYKKGVHELLYFANTAISGALIGMQAERIDRMNQGEG